MSSDPPRQDIDPSESGERLDQVMARRLPEHSRSRLARWIREGRIRLDGAEVRPSTRVHAGQQIDLRIDPAEAPPPEENPGALPGARPQNLSLEPMFADDQVMIIDKPAGLVVHPAAGHRDGTLVNALLHLDPALAELPRAGIVHRLDKDTTGLMVVARTLTAHTALVRQLQARTVARRYLALVYGAVISGDRIDEPLGRHPADRKKMAVRSNGRPAVTHFRLARRYRDFSLLDVRLETGRTHQIRVHLAHRHFPIVGDPVYGVRMRLPAGAGAILTDALGSFRRQALHAAELGFDHPGTGEPVSFQAPLPADFQRLLDAIDAESSQCP